MTDEAVEPPRQQPETFKILADGTCAYCWAYRAMWLSECKNPIHWLFLDKSEPGHDHAEDDN